MTYEDKKEALRTLPLNSDTANRLFFAARNGAISNLILTVERHLDDLGYRVRADWHESSVGNPAFTITFFDRREHPRSWSVERESLWPTSQIDSLSQQTYRLHQYLGGYDSRLSQKAEAFDKLVSGQQFFDFLAEQVNGVNYPFTYSRYSVF